MSRKDRKGIRNLQLGEKKHGKFGVMKEKGQKKSGNSRGTERGMGKARPGRDITPT